jgi:hypothetical protein
MNIRRILISEQEKNEIKNLYGVLSEETSNYLLDDPWKGGFTVISTKEKPGDKIELTINLSKIYSAMYRTMDPEFDTRLKVLQVPDEKKTGRLIYHKPSGMIQLIPNPPIPNDSKTSKEIMLDLNDVFTNIVTTGINISEFKDKNLVSKLKSKKLSSKSDTKPNVKSDTKTNVKSDTKTGNKKPKIFKLKLSDEERCVLPNDKKWNYAKQKDRWFASKNNVDWFDITNKKNAISVLKTGCKSIKDFLSFVPPVITDDNTMAPPTTM